MAMVMDVDPPIVSVSTDVAQRQRLRLRLQEEEILLGLMESISRRNRPDSTKRIKQWRREEEEVRELGRDETGRAALYWFRGKTSELGMLAS